MKEAGLPVRRGNGWTVAAFTAVASAACAVLALALGQDANYDQQNGPVAELVGIEGGVVSGVSNLESTDVGASDRRPRHEEQYHEV